MKKLYAYKQYVGMKTANGGGWLISWSEKPRQEHPFEDGVYLGSVEIKTEELKS